jgi:hypothetical protein
MANPQPSGHISDVDSLAAAKRVNLAIIRVFLIRDCFAHCPFIL